MSSAFFEAFGVGFSSALKEEKFVPFFVEQVVHGAHFFAVAVDAFAE